MLRSVTQALAVGIIPLFRNIHRRANDDVLWRVQDVQAAFCLGTDTRTINRLAYDGVNLAAIKALEERTAQPSKMNQLLSQRNVELAEKLEQQQGLTSELLRRLDALERRSITGSESHASTQEN